MKMFAYFDPRALPWALLYRPFRTEISRAVDGPRALPWAILFAPFRLRTYKLANTTPRPYQPGDVKRVRERLGASQAVLARLLGVNVNTVRSWEQGKRPPQPIACRFLAEIEARPGYWRRRIGRIVEVDQPI